jgi:low temperature requirement protein LtrA
LELFGQYFSIGEKRRGSKVKKEGKLTFCYTKFISIHIIFGKKEKKKKREKNSCQIFPSRTKLPCHELLFLFLFPQINKKEKEQRKGYSLSFCFQKLSRKEYHLSL